MLDCSPRNPLQSNSSVFADGYQLLQEEGAEAKVCVCTHSAISAYWKCFTQAKISPWLGCQSLNDTGKGTKERRTSV